MEPIVAAAVIVALVLGMAAFVHLRLRSRGQAAKLTRAFWPYVIVMAVVVAVSSWAFATDHAAIGIGLLVAFYVVPELVLIPLRIRRSSAAARRGREARRARALDTLPSRADDRRE